MRLTVIPDPHQVRAISFLCPLKRGLLFYATGSGKSLCQLVTAARLLKDGVVDKFLIVGTKNSVLELSGDSSKFLEYDMQVIRDKEDLLNFLHKSDKPMGLQMYNAIDSREALEIVESIGSVRLGILLDEVHVIKNPESLVTRTYAMLFRACTRAYGATATAIISDLMDLFYLVDTLIPGYLGTKKDFCNRYLDRRLETVYTRMGPRKAWKTYAYQNLDDLHERMKKIMVTFYPDMPVKYVTLSSELTDEDQYLSTAKDVFGEKKSAMARMVSLQHQVNEDPNKLGLLKSAVVDRLGSGVLVYCSYYQAVDKVKELFDREGIQYKEINGKMSIKGRKETKDWFIENPANKVVIITLGGGQSLNLQATNSIIFYDIPFAVGFYTQILGRVVRWYSEFRDTEFEVVHIVLKDTIDEYKSAYLEQNQEPVAAVLGNKMGSKIDLPKFKSYVLDQLRQRLVWKKQLRGRKKQ